MGRIGILPFVIESRNCEKLPHRDNEYNWGAPRIVLFEPRRSRDLGYS